MLHWYSRFVHAMAILFSSGQMDGSTDFARNIHKYSNGRVMGRGENDVVVLLVPHPKLPNET